MVVNPRVLFLDEPTSGLDSYTSNETMTVVKSLVKEGVTICATIHSPSPYTFALFDRLLVLVRGECVYHGPNGQRMVRPWVSSWPAQGLHANSRCRNNAWGAILCHHVKMSEFAMLCNVPDDYRIFQRQCSRHFPSSVGSCSGATDAAMLGVAIGGLSFCFDPLQPRFLC